MWPVHRLTIVAALFHSLCLDKNGKESIPRVVNIVGAPSTLFSHHSYLFLIFAL